MAATITDHKRNQLTLSYFLAFVTLGMASASLGPALPYLAENTGSLLSRISILFISNRIGSILGSLVGGHLYDSKPGNIVMAIMLLLIALGLIFIPLAASLYLLLAVILAVGFARGAVDVGGNVLIVWTHQQKHSQQRLPSLMNALHLSYGVGAFLVPLIIALAVQKTGTITWGFWLLTLLVLPNCLWLFRLPSPESRPSATEKSTINGGYLFPALITAFLFLCIAAEAAFGGWIYTYSLVKGLANRISAAYLTSAYWGGLTVGRLIFTLLAVKLKPRIILLLSLGGSLLSISSLLIWSDSAAVTWTGSIGFGFFLASIFPSTITLASRTMKLTGKVTGVFLVGASSGAMLLPWLIGQLFEPVGPWVTIVLILASIVLAFFILAAIILLQRRST
jgi:fucose permease